MDSHSHSSLPQPVEVVHDRTGETPTDQGRKITYTPSGGYGPLYEDLAIPPDKRKRLEDQRQRPSDLPPRTNGP
jgi:hypothetical protein